MKILIHTVIKGQDFIIEVQKLYFIQYAFGKLIRKFHLHFGGHGLYDLERVRHFHALTPKVWQLLHIWVVISAGKFGQKPRLFIDDVG